MKRIDQTKRIMIYISVLCAAIILMPVVVGADDIASATPVSIGHLNCPADGTITAPIMLSGIQNYGTAKINITYNPTVVHVTGVASSSDSTVITHNKNNSAGIASITAWNTDGVSGDIVFANITFTAVGTGTTSLNLDVSKLADTSMQLIPLTISNGSIGIESLQPLTPFLIQGYVHYENGSECNNPIVNITNLDTGGKWTAETIECSNYYYIMLGSADVITGEILQFNVVSPDGSQSVVTEHTVTQDEINNGGLFNNNITLVVLNQPPVADPNGPYTGAEGTEIAFDGSASSDPDGSIVSYDWDFGDGTSETGVSPVHTYVQNGTYTVNLTVTDNAGATDSATTTAVVVNLVDTIAPELTLELVTEGDNNTLYIYSSENLSTCTVTFPDLSSQGCIELSTLYLNWSCDLVQNGTYVINGTDGAGNVALRNLTLEIGTINATDNNWTQYESENVQLGITTKVPVENSSITICEYNENPVNSLETTTISLFGINKFVQIEVDDDLNASIETVRIYINYSGANLTGIDEDSLKLHVWNDSIESWEELEPSGIDTDNTIVWGELNHLSLFSILGEEPDEYVPPGNGGGGSSSGGGASGEPYDNIASSETDRQYVNQNSDISYSFELECNIVQFVKFTSLKSAGKIATKVEILKDTSALVDNPPSDIVYKNLNIWVGNAGWGTKRNIADATVVFTVDKLWITENNIDESSIALYRYSDDTWHKLVTKKIAEDANSLQFEAETPGFSPFAVTGKELEGEPGGEGIIAGPTATVDKNPAPTPTEKKGMPGFTLFAGLSVLLIAVQLLRKKK